MPQSQSMSNSTSDLKKTSGPLTGLKVLDMTQFILGPVATQILGDMGADIIKIESPEGDPNRFIGPSRAEGMAALYMGMNRNKRSAVLNLKNPLGKDALYRMVKECDVFLHSLRPDAAERLGVSYSDIRALNPSIIYASAPGYRSDGPRRNRPAYDDVIQGQSGIAGMNFLANGQPRYFPTVLADKFCGYVLASSISMALFHRERTGEGQSVEVPMLETMLSFNLIEHLWTGNFDEPMGPLGYERALMPHRRPMATLDGHICLMATTDSQWEKLFSALERPDLKSDPRFLTVSSRSAHFPELYGAVGESIATQTTAHWQERLDIADIPNAPVAKLADLPSDPYLVETGYFHRYSHATAGPLVTTSIPVKFSTTPGQLRQPPPTLGEHTHEILKEFGFQDHEISNLKT
jgi:crotonobetainyl-CoA:carnitine CoA-transferase CaiB-like acyl-CoA transferase